MEVLTAEWKGGQISAAKHQVKSVHFNTADASDVETWSQFLYVLNRIFTSWSDIHCVSSGSGTPGRNASTGLSILKGLPQTWNKIKQHKCLRYFTSVCEKWGPCCISKLFIFIYRSSCDRKHPASWPVQNMHSAYSSSAAEEGINQQLTPSHEDHLSPRRESLDHLLQSHSVCPGFRKRVLTWATNAALPINHNLNLFWSLPSLLDHLDSLIWLELEMIYL